MYCLNTKHLLTLLCDTTLQYVAFPHMEVSYDMSTCMSEGDLSMYLLFMQEEGNQGI